MDRLVPFFCGSVVSSKRVHMCPAKNLTRPAALKSHCRCKLARMDESAPTFHFARPGPALSEFVAFYGRAKGTCPFKPESDYCRVARWTGFGDPIQNDLARVIASHASGNDRRSVLPGWRLLY